MKSTEYLYGLNDDKIYKELFDHQEKVAKIKLDLCNKLLSELIEVDFMDRDDERIYHIKEAIDYNLELLEEINKWREQN